MEDLVEWRLVGETEVLGENLAQRHFVHHKSHLTRPGSNPGYRGAKPGTNRLSYGAAYNRRLGANPMLENHDFLAGRDCLFELFVQFHPCDKLHRLN
jgi:hypothetical protein